ncbi:uncharacterized protein LOC110987431 [Acanthaster planci]|uniref:Uncharacterized protein LOC110987431 n=1 Tax=Acanthaster planci TaxID=133434 RepID=A0A8B7ZLC9_ACAPL|nr:uncharacterized protein LOC110987431 [Acanthaster planci]
MDSKEASLKYKQSLMRDMLPDLTTDIKRLEQSLAASSRAQQRFTENVTMTVKAVQDRAAKMRAEITSQEKKLIGEINQTQQDRNRMFEEHQKTISTMLQGKQNSLVMAKEITDTASERGFLSLYPIISKDLISLKRPNPPKIDHELSYLNFTPDPRIDKLNLGKIKLKIDKWDKRHEFGKRGSSRGKFDMARGIAAAQTGDVAVADCWNKRVVICDNEGQHKKYIPLQSRPWDTATIHNHDNQLVVVDDTKYVKVFDKKNKLAFQFPTVPQSEVDKTEVNLCSVAVRKDGTILVGDVKRMVWTEHRPTDGQLLHTVPVQTPPYFLAVDDCSDRVVVCGSNKQKVDIASSNGRILASIKPTISGPPVMHCFGVCCSSSEIYIAVCNEPGTGHIHHYDLDGIFLTCLAQGLYSPRGITFTSDEQLAVADKYSVKRYHKV